ncbi:MAG: short-chain dehydrogenase [Candidatus Melainabacteria bacterium HGW-Melainabacteria-1]|nr:MAG: short-chain dehydrogenase [Candidatus Melainabacteria bacterium HGW-Melainabacteria-1]
MAPKTILISGATSGIGQAAALALAGQGHRLVLLARNPKRAEMTINQIANQTGNQDIEVIACDLASLASVREAARQFGQRPLDVLINNAGGIRRERQLGPEGLEWTFTVNHLAPLLLTHLLVDQLAAAAPARVIHTVSAGERSGKIDFGILNGEQRYSMFAAYCNAKLAETMCTFVLAEKLQTQGIAVNCVHPGVVRTRFGEDSGWLMQLMSKLVYPFLLSPEQGAQTLVYLATSPEAKGITGKYWEKGKAVPSSPRSLDAEIGRQLYAVSLEKVGLPK